MLQILEINNTKVTGTKMPFIFVFLSFSKQIHQQYKNVEVEKIVEEGAVRMKEPEDEEKSCEVSSTGCGANAAVMVLQQPFLPATGPH